MTQARGRHRLAFEPIEHERASVLAVHAKERRSLRHPSGPFDQPSRCPCDPRALAVQDVLGTGLHHHRRPTSQLIRLGHSTAPDRCNARIVQQSALVDGRYVELRTRVIVLAAYEMLAGREVLPIAGIDVRVTIRERGRAHVGVPSASASVHAGDAPRGDVTARARTLQGGTPRGFPRMDQRTSSGSRRRRY
jgi:hypothetical protein